jgi:hypothetical protein
VERGGQSPALGRGEGLGPIDPRGVFPPVVLGNTPHRSQSSIPGLHEQLLQLVDGSDIFPWRGSVNPLLEAEDMALHLLPRDALPGHLQGPARCCGTWPLTPGFPLQHTGPTSAKAWV